jgi:hypothetical protein
MLCEKGIITCPGEKVKVMHKEGEAKIGPRKDTVEAPNKLLMKLISGPWKLLYFPICRAYARYIVGDKAADSVMCFLCGLYFLKVHGYRPHFKSPRSFMEKVWSRMLFDRDPIWTMFSDKLRVRDYVASKVGSEYLVPLLWSGNKPEEIPFGELPLKFVIKANHGCGYNILVRDKTQLDQTKARRQLKKWLGENFCEDTLLGIAWAYKKIKPTIMVESFLENNGSVPEDYKFFCYSGRAEFCKVDLDRFGDHSEVFFDRGLKPLDLFGVGIKQYRGKFVLPDNYQDMVRVAESLAQGIDFSRVDLYSVSGHIYFGEFTCYHGGGLIALSPRKYDFLLGEKWKYGNHGRNQV